MGEEEIFWTIEGNKEGAYEDNKGKGNVQKFMNVSAINIHFLHKFLIPMIFLWPKM